jgi:hypothetical protein
VQIPLSLLFLELRGYYVNAVQHMSTPQTSWSGATYTGGLQITAVMLGDRATATLTVLLGAELCDLRAGVTTQTIDHACERAIS